MSAPGGSELHFALRLNLYRSATLEVPVDLVKAADELGYGPEITDAVIIWQGGGAAPARHQADAKIKIIWPGVRAELA